VANLLRDVGGENVIRAFFRDDLPEDPEQIFLTSWGEWWPKDVYGLTLDKALQDKCEEKRQRRNTQLPRAIYLY